jgi:hypothetical protein
MARGPREEDRPTEDDIAKGKLGPRGVPGEPDNRTMTPQQEKTRRIQGNSTVMWPEAKSSLRLASPSIALNQILADDT